ncbi:hypothetical protein BH20ACT3_BH20ACT3_05550 [soil metagenome]
MSERPGLQRWAHPGWATLLGRGVRKRCPRCGGGDLYTSWFRMRDRCLRCGLRFEREPGFFVGAYLINFAIAIGTLFAVSMAFVALQVLNPGSGVAGPLIVGLVVAIVIPPVCYPYSRTIWSAIDIGMTPLEPDEEAEATAALATSSPNPLPDQARRRSSWPDRTV